MIFGHNTNVAIGADTVHVQTEDRGPSNAVLDTTVHWKGRVLHRRTSNYQDLLPLDSGKEAALKARLDDQHRAVIEELRSGALKLTIPKIQAPTAGPTAVPARAATPVAPVALKVELTNARTWLAGKNATLQVLVHDGAGNPVLNATAKAWVEGSSAPSEFAAQTGPAGLATLQFEMPKLGVDEAALVIEVAHNGAKGHLRFQLRAKPRG